MPIRSDEDAVRAVLDAVTTGLHDRNAAAVAAQYTSSARIFDLAPPLTHAFDAAQLQAWLQTWEGPVEQQYKDRQVFVRGDLAFAHALVRVSARSTGGEEAAWWMRATVCLIREPQGWKIVHEHTSVPFYMDGSYRAATDLSP